MEGQNHSPQTQGGEMENTQSPSPQEERPMPPTLSSLLADKSLDHMGAPIPVEYKKLRATKASANREKLSSLSIEDLDSIHSDIAPAAVFWELEHGMRYQYHQSPIPDEHPGLRDAKIVPIRLNVEDGDSIDSFAGDKALWNNDFRALLPTGLPPENTPRNLERWRTYDSRSYLRQIYPAHYIVWEDPDSKALYARIPKPLEGLSRAGCDHCRIHDQERAGEYVDYFDDRRHVDDIRAMSAGDTAIIPFSLCRFHWWYLWSGELLRTSQVRALEVLVSGDLRERWGISHMRVFLLSMACQCPTPEEVRCDNLRRRGLPNPEHALVARMDKIEVALRQRIVNKVKGLEMKCKERKSKDTSRQHAESPGSPKAPGATLATKDTQQTFAGGQQASATTTNGLNGTGRPVESPRTNGQSMIMLSYASAAGAGPKGQPASKANGLIPSSTVTPVSYWQTNGSPAPRSDGFLRSPPTGPRAQRRRPQRQGQTT